MAVSQTWFQNWQPPTGLLTEHQPFKTLDRLQLFENGHDFSSGTSSSRNPVGMLPYMLSLGMISPDPKYNLKHHHHHHNHHQPSVGPFKINYIWKQVDFAYDSELERNNAVASGEFIQKNNLPLGIEIDKNRVFVTFPKWKRGIPCTLAVIPKLSQQSSPLFTPYPSWDWHNSGTCDGLVSVFRVQIDECNRLWVLDSGQINTSVKSEQVCPPKIVVFDLKTDNLILRYDFPKEFIKEDGLFSNIAVDVQYNRCEDAYAYVADVWRFGLLVFSLKQQTSWRFTDHLFYSDPLAAAYSLHGINFEWTDGIFSLALSPEIPGQYDRMLYFHPMSSFNEFYLRTSSIKNETKFNENKRQIKLLGQSRGKRGQVSTAVMDDNGIMFYNLVLKDSVGCWDSRKPYKRANLGVLAKNNVSLTFPNDLKLDKEKRQSLWVISNRLPIFLYGHLNEDDYNFRIMSAFVDEAVHGTICDPNVAYHNTFHPVPSNEDCN